MNRFSLPYCLIIEEGIYEHLDEVLPECVPDITDKRVMIVTEKALQNIIQQYLDEMQKDLPLSELYLIGQNSFEQAMELARAVFIKNFEVIIGIGGGKVLDVAKYAGFIGKIPYICLPTTLSNDSLMSFSYFHPHQGLLQERQGCHC